MTDLRKAAEMALEALEDSMYPQKKQFDAIVGLKQALAQGEPWDASDMAHRAGGLSVEQEPVAWMDKNGLVTRALYNPDESWTPLYTAPPSKPWVGLTDQEVHEAAIKCVKSGQSVNAAIRATEAKLRERNI